jgi:hypothetical protein
MAIFPSLLKTLASEAGIRVAEVDSTHAEVIFTFGDGHRQQVWITPHSEGALWEFSCLAAVRRSDPEDFPKNLLVYALRDNARNPLGFWCIKATSSGYYLDYMANHQTQSLTPREFSRTCNVVAREVEQLENAMA